MREDHQIPRFQAVLKSSETKIPLVRARLGEAAFAIEWEAGRAMTLDQAEAMAAVKSGQVAKFFRQKCTGTKYFF